MDARLFDMIYHIEGQYNSDFDVIPNGPRVTWVEMQLVQIIKLLATRLDEVEKQLVSQEKSLVRSMVGPGVDITNLGLPEYPEVK